MNLKNGVKNIAYFDCDLSCTFKIHKNIKVVEHHDCLCSIEEVEVVFEWSKIWMIQVNSFVPEIFNGEEV